MERQEAALAAWLAAHPEYQLAEALTDAGVSAGKGMNRTRGALSRFIEGGRSGLIQPGSVLVVESMSRFTREAERSALETLLRDVWGQHLAVAFAEGDGAVLTGELIDREPHRLYGLLGAISQARAEWLERSRRSRGAAAKARRLQDEGHRTAAATPWWIARDAEGRLVRDDIGSLQLDPPAAAAINRAVDLALAGGSSAAVAAALNAEGFPPPPAANCRSQYGRATAKWTHGKVSTLFGHPALVGTLVRRNADAIEGYYPAVLSADRWARLRSALESRYRLRGHLRGGSQRCHNIFQAVLRCSVCGGPISFHPGGQRSRAGHPGYLGCREGNRRGGSACSNSGYEPYDHVEAHCLTRLQAAQWESLLARPEDNLARHQLEEEVARLSADHHRLQAQLAAAERRAEALWLEDATHERQATAERALTRLREQLGLVEGSLAAASGQLAAARATPSAEEAAAELQQRVAAFWAGITTATPAERLAFNRWLLTRQPEVRFHLHPRAPGGGDRLVALTVGGEHVGFANLAGAARLLAKAAGMIEPAVAVSAPGPDGAHVAVLRAGDGPAPTRPTLQAVEEHGRRLLVQRGGPTAAASEPPFDGPWALLWADQEDGSLGLI
jgi:DNA invertase Pin-like site-specific DNA recombinase